MLFSATKQKKRKQGHRCWKASLSWGKLVYAILGVKLKYMKDVSFSKWNVICNAEDIFSCFRAFFAEFVMLELQCTKSLV